MKSPNSRHWISVMNEEMKSIKDNDIWDIISLPQGNKLVGCK